MINRMGCIAIILVLLLVVVIGLAVTNSGLQSKYRNVESEFSILKQEVSNGLDAPRILGQYMTSRNAFKKYEEELDELAERLGAAETLPQLDAIFKEFKETAEAIRAMIPQDAIDNNQRARNQEAELLGAYRRYNEQRKTVVDAAKIYNSSLSGFPTNIIGKLFGMKEVPLSAPAAEQE